MGFYIAHEKWDKRKSLAFLPKICLLNFIEELTDEWGTNKVRPCFSASWYIFGNCCFNARKKGFAVTSSSSSIFRFKYLRIEAKAKNLVPIQFCETEIVKRIKWMFENQFCKNKKNNYLKKLFRSEKYFFSFHFFHIYSVSFLIYFITVFFERKRCKKGSNKKDQSTRFNHLFLVIFFF